jgi:hypothetical protein
LRCAQSGNIYAPENFIEAVIHKSCDGGFPTPVAQKLKAQDFLQSGEMFAVLLGAGRGSGWLLASHNDQPTLYA